MHAVLYCALPLLLTQHLKSSTVRGGLDVAVNRQVSEAQHGECAYILAFEGYALSSRLDDARLIVGAILLCQLDLCILCKPAEIVKASS